MAKYSTAQAAAKARQIFDRFGSKIADVCAGSIVPEDFLGGFVGVEAGVERGGQISETATRFEPGVFHHLSLVRSGFVSSWSKITTADLKGATDDALRNLATSYGLTQIMGWHVIHDLQCSVNDLRDPEKHLGYAVELLIIDGGSWLRRKNWDAVLHIWNSGTPTGRTYDPDYVHNALAVKAAYAALMAARNSVAAPLGETDSAADSAQADDAQLTAGSDQSATIPEQPSAIGDNDSAAAAGTLPAGDGEPSTTSLPTQPPSSLDVGGTIDKYSGVASQWQSRGDAVKAMWASISHVTIQPIWAMLAWVLHMPWWMYVGVAAFVALTYVLYHHRQLVMGKLRETFGLQPIDGGKVTATATVETKTEGGV